MAVVLLQMSAQRPGGPADDQHRRQHPGGQPSPRAALGSSLRPGTPPSATGTKDTQETKNRAVPTPHWVTGPRAYFPGERLPTGGARAVTATERPAEPPQHSFPGWRNQASSPCTPGSPGNPPRNTTHPLPRPSSQALPDLLTLLTGRDSARLSPAPPAGLVPSEPKTASCSASRPHLPGLLKGSGSQLGVILSPRGHLAVSGDFFGCHQWGGVGVLLASSRERSRVLNTLQCTEHPTAEHHPAHNVQHPQHPAWRACSQ